LLINKDIKIVAPPFTDHLCVNFPILCLIHGDQWVTLYFTVSLLHVTCAYHCTLHATNPQPNPNAIISTY